MPDIQFSQLSKADIILTTASDSLVSGAIRTATNSIISHAMLVSRAGYIIDSTESGAQERSWTEASKGVTFAVALRRGNLTKLVDQEKVVDAARCFLGRGYDMVGAVGSGMYGKQETTLKKIGCSLNAGCTVVAMNADGDNADLRFFCSELVARAFTVAGFPIVGGRATDTTPQMILVSNWLRRVGCLIDIRPKPMTEEERQRNRRAGWRKDV